MSLYSEFSRYYEEAFPLRQEVVDFLKAHFTNKEGTILDLGCGPGHYCGLFQQDGFSVMGIDLDEKMISAARRKYPDARFACMDLNRIESITERFDTIYSIGNVLAHITPEQFSTLLSVINKLLHPGGHWIFQVVNWDHLLALRQYTFPVKSLAGGRITFHREYEDISEERVTFHIFMQSEDKTLFDERITLYPLRSDDYLKLHTSTGFHPVGLYADFNKMAYRKEVNGVNDPLCHGIVFCFGKRITF